MYQQAQAAQQAGGAAGFDPNNMGGMGFDPNNMAGGFGGAAQNDAPKHDNVVDADFEVVDEDK